MSASMGDLYSRAAIECIAAGVRLGDVAVGWDSAGEPDVAADHRAAPDGDAAEDGCAGVDDDVVFDDRVAWQAFDERTGFIDREAFGAERHGLVEPHAFADHGRLADNDSGAVVDEETGADLRARMNVDAG